MSNIEEVVTERQMFLQESFLDSLKWGYGVVNQGISLKDFMASTIDLPSANISTSEKDLTIPYPWNHNRHFSETNSITVVTDKIEERKDSNNMTNYEAKDYFAIIIRGSGMMPRYIIDIYTRQKKGETTRIQKELEGKQTLMKFSKKYRALSEDVKWDIVFSSVPQAS